MAVKSARSPASAAFVPPTFRPATRSAWAVGDYALVRRLNQQALKDPTQQEAAAAELRRLQLDRVTAAYGVGSVLLLLAAWAWAVAQ